MLFSCNTADNNDATATFYKDTQFIQEHLSSVKIDSISEHLKSPTHVYLLDDYLIIFENKSDKILHLFNLKNKKYQGAYIDKGQGPGEVAFPWSLSKEGNKEFILYDAQLRKILGYQIDSLINNDSFFLEQKFNQSGATNFVTTFDDTYFFTDESNFNNSIYSIGINTESSQINGYGKPPVLVSASDSDAIKATAASTFMAAKNGTFVLAYRLSPRIEIFNYKNNEWKTIISPENFEIDYTVASEEGETFFAVNKNTRLAYLDVVLTDKYIYALYGKNKLLESMYGKGRTIYVYDYDGNPIKKLVLDKDIVFFDVKNDESIYALSVDLYPEILNFKIK